MTGGRLDALLTELAGLDIGEALVALVGDVESVPIDCAYLNAHGEDGVFTIKTAVVDTRDTLFLADGAVNFKRERLDLVIEPRPKDFSLLSLRAPLTLEGPIRQPRYSVGRSAFARGAAAALLGLVAPPAALVPLLQPESGAEPAYCNGLINSLDQAR